MAEPDIERRLEDDASRSALADALATVGDRWTLLLVAALLDGPRRFGELQEEVDGIAPNVLTQRLRALERNALVVARPVLRAPAPVRLRAQRRRARARRRAAAARRLGRPQRRGLSDAPPRRVRHADGGALVVPDVRASGRRRRGRGAALRLTRDQGADRHASTGPRSRDLRTSRRSQWTGAVALIGSSGLQRRRSPTCERAAGRGLDHPGNPDTRRMGAVKPGKNCPHAPPDRPGASRSGWPIRSTRPRSRPRSTSPPASAPATRVAEFTFGVFAVYFLGGAAIALGPGQLILSLVPSPDAEDRHVLEIIAGARVARGRDCCSGATATGCPVAGCPPIDRERGSRARSSARRSPPSSCRPRSRTSP